MKKILKLLLILIASILFIGQFSVYSNDYSYPITEYSQNETNIMNINSNEFCIDVPIENVQEEQCLFINRSDEEMENIKAETEKTFQYAELTNNSEPADFYNYSSDYSYKDAEKRSYSADRKALYNDILNFCQDFETNFANVRTTKKSTTTRYVDSNGNEVGRKTYYFYSLQYFSTYEYNLSRNDIVEVFFSFRHDHPEIYWLSSNLEGSLTAICINMDAEFIDGTVRQDYNSKIDSSIKEYHDAVKTEGYKTNYDIALFINNKIIDTVDYAYNEYNCPEAGIIAHSIIGVFDDDPSTDVVCEGYAKSYQLLLNSFCIDNIYIANDTHVWNMVKMDDNQYYNFDVTWNDSTNNKYFAKGISFYSDHTPNSPQYTGTHFLYEIPTSPDDDFVPIILPIPLPFETANNACSVVNESVQKNDEYTLIEAEINKNTNDIDKAVAIIAGYNNNGSVIEIKTAEIPFDIQQSVFISEKLDNTDISYIRFFILGNSYTIQPLCQAEQCNVSEIPNVN